MKTRSALSTPTRNPADDQQVLAKSNGSHETPTDNNVQSNSVVLTSPHDCVCQTVSTSTSQTRKLLEVGVTPQTKSSKNLDYIIGGAVTKSGKTLYCKAEMMVPFTFTYGSECDPRSRIRVRAEYTEERYMKDTVERCPNHLVKDGSNVKMHFVRCEHAETEYLDVSEKYALRIPLCDSTGFMFMCFNSCSGGINRRPVQLTFTLEGVDGRCLDSSSVPMKVCANPLRDASKEQRLPENNFQTMSNNNPVIQRKRQQKVRSDDSKRPNHQDYFYETAQLIEFHFSDPAKVTKCLWYLANEEKFDQLICMDVDNNPFRDICVITAGTSIKAWLNKREVGLGSHADKFERHSIFTLGDLASIYDQSTFARFGFEPSQCAVLNRAFQDWYLNNRASAMRDVESDDGLYESFMSYSVTNL